MAQIERALSQNLHHHLWDRESGYSRNAIHIVPPFHQWFERCFLKSITPNFTIQNVNKPPGYMRKFTPDGRLLISFSQNQRNLEVFEYRGVHAVLSVIKDHTSECIIASDHSSGCEDVREKLFEGLFHIKWIISVEHGTAASLLNREFSIFLCEGRYILVAATKPSDTVIPPIEDLDLYSDLCDDVEFLSYTFYLIDLQLGCVSDRIKYPYDSINLSHNHGVTTHGRIVSVLSRYKQTIYLYELVQGKLMKLTSIGDFRDELDSSLFMKPPENRSLNTNLTAKRLPLSFLKQRILTYIYKNIINVEVKVTQQRQLQKFCQDYNKLERMLLSKIQLINEDHLLIRYEEREEDSIVCGNESGDFKLYVFYCISKGTILRVFPKDSTELLFLLRDFCDCFRNVRSLQTQRPSSSPSNNAKCREAFNSTIRKISGGVSAAALRFNSTLPISSQSFATTQYLDCSLFDYDDRLISPLERPKIGSAQPIKFTDHSANITKFRLFLEDSASRFDNNCSSNLVSSNRELVAFIYHPFDPLFISVQKKSSRYNVNIHIYNGSTFVKK